MLIRLVQRKRPLFFITVLLYTLFCTQISHATSRSVIAGVANKGLVGISSDELLEVEKHRVSDPDVQYYKPHSPLLGLTDTEEQWLQNHKSIRLSGPKAFPPFHFFSKNGQAEGIAAEYIGLIFDLLQLTPDVQSGLFWPEVLKKTKDKEIDLISLSAKSADREEYLLFTEPHLSFPLVIVTKTDAQFVSGIEDLHDKQIAFVEGIVTYDWILKDKINVTPHFVKTPLDALQAVSSGEADAAIDNLAAATYLILHNGLANLKIAAPTHYGSYDLHIAVRKDWPELVSIINKALSIITPKQHSEILNRWLSVRFEYGISKSDVVRWILTVIGLFSVILVIVAFWNRRLKREIDERRKAEEALRRSEAQQRKMIANIGDVIVIIDQNGINRYKSPNIESLFGWKPEEIVGANTFDNVHPEDLESTKKFVGNLISEPNAVGTIECRYKCKDGSYRWIEFTGSNLLLDPDIQGILGNYHDITERQHAEQTLSESETRFKALHNASFGGISIHDKGIILECNRGLVDMTGYSTTELIGMNGLLLIAEKSRDYVMEKILSGYEKPYETIGLRKNGEEYPIRLEARNIPYKGKTVRTVEFRDITDRRRAEEDNAKLAVQLQQAQKMESVGRLAGGVAHDFNNMLSVILGHAELALREMDPAEPIFAGLQEIRKAAKSSADLTRQLLAFARKQIVAPKVLDLNDTVEGMLSMLRRLIGEDIDLEWVPAPNLWSVKIDPSQVDQILANLCVNARDAIGGTGKVIIETDTTVFDEYYCATHAGYAPGEYVLLAVNDSGSGMDSETRSQLFEPFFTTKEVGKGTGLGLAMIYGIIKQNNGFIRVYSEPGQGATFNIYLPRHTAKTGQKQRVETMKPNARGQETILLVEDEPMILDLTTTMLEFQGYKVLPAETPGMAIHLARQHAGEIQLLMTDVIMPEMNGRDLAKDLLSLYPKLRCLFISGYTADVIAHHGVLDDSVHFIQKPFDLKDLASKIREVID